MKNKEDEEYEKYLLGKNYDVTLFTNFLEQQNSSKAKEILAIVKSFEKNSQWLDFINDIKHKMMLHFF